MLPSFINDDELLYRAIIRIPYLWKNEDNRPSSAAFKDSKGVSVDRDGEREEAEIIRILKSKFGLKAIVKLQASYCRSIETKVVARPLEDNIFHAEIHDLDKVTLSAAKAKKLAKACEIVFKVERDS
jgi:hypothetical protein